jgi:hypothetical protein
MAGIKHKLASEDAGTEVTLATDPNAMTTSAPRLISGIVTDVTDVYDSINSNTGVLAAHFTFNYKLPTDANWTNGVTFATLKPILINTSDANRRIYVTATNLTSLVPAAAILNIKR